LLGLIETDGLRDGLCDGLQDGLIDGDIDGETLGLILKLRLGDTDGLAENDIDADSFPDIGIRERFGICGSFVSRSIPQNPRRLNLYNLPQLS
jgi:hypothetical protein